MIICPSLDAWADCILNRSHREKLRWHNETYFQQNDQTSCMTPIYQGGSRNVKKRGSGKRTKKVMESRLQLFRKNFWIMAAPLHGPSVTKCLVPTDISINTSHSVPLWALTFFENVISMGDLLRLENLNCNVCCGKLEFGFKLRFRTIRLYCWLNFLLTL